jgi:alpha-galactosidase
MNTRRDFLTQTALAAVGASLTAPIVSAFDQTRVSASGAAPGMINLLRPADLVTAITNDRSLALKASQDGWWVADGIEVQLVRAATGVMRVRVSAPSSAVKQIRLRWRGHISETSRILGDAWERGYGDLEWRGIVPDRVMPWYVAIDSGSGTQRTAFAREPVPSAIGRSMRRASR